MTTFLWRHLRILALCCLGSIAAVAQSLAGCGMFPANNIWNTPIDTLPAHSQSASIVTTIGGSKPLHPDFGTAYGIPFVVVSGTQTKVPVSFTYADESDPGPYPIPANAP